MKKIISLLSAVLALFAVGCSKDITANDEVGKIVNTLTVDIEGSNDTRLSATHSAAGFKFNWDAADAIYVVPAEAGNYNYGLYIYKSNGTFEFSAGGTPMEVGKKYYAVYGTKYGREDMGFNSEGQIRTFLRMSSTVGATTSISWLPMISEVFTCTADGTIATMHHVAGVIEAPVKVAEGTQKMTLFGLYSGTNTMSGWVSVSPSATPEWTVAKYDNGSIGTTKYVDWEGELSLTTTEQSIFIPVLPDTYTNINVYYNLGDETNRETDEEHYQTNLVVERGKITKLPVTTLVPEDN
ncbi:MAG: hypothetical protein IJN45_00545 [Alistipes sp.]|nr:hypothetical protein [Alistipes sp.]